MHDDVMPPNGSRRYSAETVVEGNTLTVRPVCTRLVMWSRYLLYSFHTASL